METVERDGVSLVQEYRRAVEERDLERLRALVHPEFELRTSRKDRTLTLDDMDEQWSRGDAGGFDHLDVEVRPGEPREVDGSVVVENEHVLRWKETGEVAATVERAQVFSLDDGRIRSVETYPSAQQAWARVEDRA